MEARERRNIGVILLGWTIWIKLFDNVGDHTPNGWKLHVYTAAVRNVRENCNVEITKDHVLSRCKTFDKHCSIVSKILAHAEFGWDQEKNRLVIHNEDAWTRYIEDFGARSW